MDITDRNAVGEVVAADYRTASVFQKFGIDFCCKGDRIIADVCGERGINSSTLIGDLQASLKGPDLEASDFNSWPLDLLADYIQNRHHRYVEQRIEEIKPYLAKIVSVHGARHPELAEIERLFSQSAGELAVHMKKEEFILFPFIRKLVKAANEGLQVSRPHFTTVENPVAMMKHDHAGEGERFMKISLLSGQYAAPADACTTYRVALALLKEFEDDLHLHIHLENNILFPKTIELEKRLLSENAQRV